VLIRGFFFTYFLKLRGLGASPPPQKNVPVKQFLKNRRTGVPPVLIGEAGQEENFRRITFPCEAKILEKTRAKTRKRKVFERFLNKRSVPLRLCENLLKKLRGLAA